jgi:hypothetical protein
MPNACVQQLADGPYFVDQINRFSAAMERYDRVVRMRITCGGGGSEEGSKVTHCDKIHRSA